LKKFLSDFVKRVKNCKKKEQIVKLFSVIVQLQHHTSTLHSPSIVVHVPPFPVTIVLPSCITCLTFCPLSLHLF